MEKKNKISKGVRVLICTGLYPPDIGGPATYSKILHDELPKQGIDVEILSFGIVRNLPKIIRHIVYFLKVLRRAGNAEVIYAQGPVSTGFPSAIVSILLRKKLVLKVVGDYAWEQARQRFHVKDLLDDFISKKYSWKIELLRKIQKFSADRADVVIVPSEYLKRIVVAWGIGAGKIKVIFNAFDAPHLTIDKEEARKKFNLSGTVLISAGRLVPWKGFDMLIEIMPDILKEIPNVKLIIIGSGPEREVLESQVISHKLQDKVFLVGQVSHKDVLIYLKAGDIFILNTGYEGLSHQLLEAMALGIPIITTDVGGNPELIENDKEGMLVEYNDKEALRRAIIDVYRSGELRNKLIKNAKEKIKKFSKERMIRESIKILKNYEKT